jgi:precorrin-3B C17-methyltransferase
LARAEVVVGYGPYIDLIRSLIGDTPTIVTGMTQEVRRVEAALAEALAGRRVALVSSGDPGIYAMAGLVLELCAARGLDAVPAGTPAGRGVAIEVVPGIPALCAGAALLGAPLTHDFAAISLSDLLTPWETIERRIAAAAQADFVIVIYNPKSRKRDWQLRRAQEIVALHRAGNTPVGIVTSAMRQGQTIQLTTLERLHTAAVDMQTTVFIGNGSTRRWGDFMFTPRGYGRKYAMPDGAQPACPA